MDFESEIIFHDEDHDFSSFKTRDISDQISKKLESIVLDEGSNTKRNRGTKSSSKLPRAKADKKLTSSKTYTILFTCESGSMCRNLCMK